MPDGDYVLGELPVYVKDGMARLKETNNLAGSILLLKDAVKNVVDWNVATPEDAVMMAWNIKKLTNKIGQFYEYQFNSKEKNSEIQFFKLHFAIFITEAVY